jgi:glycosyltransferase involved in cell wall biosynthesis
MKVTLASLDHLHMLNQAQGLLEAGHLQGYFSTRVRPEIEHIPAERGHSCYPLHYAIRVMQRWPWLVGGNHFYLQLCRLFDCWVKGRFFRESDILTILSGVGLNSFRVARKSGIITIVDCGSTHTDFQHRIVLDEFRRNGITKPLFSEAYRARVRQEFIEADFIQIPTRFVGRTFTEAGIPEKKLLYAPYGTDLKLFHAREKPDERQPFRVICSSGVNLRKGARILSAAWRKLGWLDAELHWVGQPTPETQHLFVERLPGLIWHSHMSHKDLASLYRQCDVMTLPSFEEGLARVIIEAAASGLPCIVTPNTGAEDFFSPQDPEGWLIPVNDIDALCEALQSAKDHREKTFLMGQRASKRAQSFSWDAYHRRVIENYQLVLSPH